MSKIDETLKKIAGDMLSGKSPTADSQEDDLRHDMPGNPGCPHCGGLGYLRTDLPVGHPDFGKLQICACRQAQVGRQIKQRLFSMSNLNELGHLTFDNFKVRGPIGLGAIQADSLERAYNHSQQFAQRLEGWLLLSGGYGCGKTHLAAAIANFAVSMGVPTLFITVPDLLDTLRFAYSDPDETFESRFDDIRQAKLLIMDDFGTHNATTWAQEKLFQILNYRYINHLPLVVTTNLAIEQIEGRIRSRLQDPELVSRVHILAPDYRNPTDDMGGHELSMLPLLRSRTFATFDLRQGEQLNKEEKTSLDKAFRAARNFAENPSGWLVLSGGYGCGKTHLAAAIANYLADQGQPPIMVSVPDLFDYLRATFSPNSAVSLDRRFEEIRTAPLLILDDLGTQSLTPWVREKLYQLFNYRYMAELPTVVTTAHMRDEMDARLKSRLLDTRLATHVGITVPPYVGDAVEESKTSTRRRRMK